jgi:hypothetical protein
VHIIAAPTGHHGALQRRYALGITSLCRRLLTSFVTAVVEEHEEQEEERTEEKIINEGILDRPC